MTIKQILAASLAVLILLPFTLFADMYKWIDENGNVHYTDSPPPGKKAKKLELKINSITGPGVVSTIGKQSPQSPAAGTAKVKLYTTTWCGYCKRAKAYLQARGTSFQEIDVETSAQGQREFQALGGRGVPVILVGNQRMDGYSEGTLAGMLKQAGL
ncbi:MAG TPA: glutaredoxin family protein [Burkholderiales bacterium]|nr:glutaredoxin family protein [Burkholderiales bacterium]